MAAGGASGCGETAEQCRAEVERLNRELQEANREKVRAAECGLSVLEENHRLKEQNMELEAQQEALRMELEQLQEAFGHAYSTQRKVAEDGESNEQTLLRESASTEAYYTQRVLELQEELELSKTSVSRAQDDQQQLSTLLEELTESNQRLELQQRHLQEELRQNKLREAGLMQDCSDLEEENISLQKMVSTLRQNQVEYEGLKHELKVLEEEAELLGAQLQDAVRLKEVCEAQLEETLESVKSEREQKSALRRELLLHLSMCDVPYTGSAHLVFSSAPPSGAATPTTLLSPGSEEAFRWNGHMTGSNRTGRSSTSDLCSEMKVPEVTRLKQQLLTVECENAALMNSLQESQSQLLLTQNALSDQQQVALRLGRTLTALQHVEGDEGEKPDEAEESQSSGLEVLKCRYRAAVTEVVQLKAEMKKLRERLNEDETPKHVSDLHNLQRKTDTLEQSCRDTQEKVEALEAELQVARTTATDTGRALSAAQDELVTLSEELALLYNHVCLCNNTTPQRVMLDYYRQGRALSVSLKSSSSDNSKVLLTPRLARRLTAAGGSPPKEEDTVSSAQALAKPRSPPGHSPSLIASSSSSSSSSSPPLETSREPMNIYNLNAIIREQVQQLQRAVELCLQRSRRRAVVRDVCPLMDMDKESCVEEILKLKAVLSTKREQISTLRLVLKANKQTAEGALSNLKSKYEAEKSMVTDTMTKLRNELKALKEDAATFSSLRAMFATRCDEYVTQLDEMQRQLAAAEDEKKTLNSLLRMAIQQKLALTQRLEDLAFDQEQSHHSRGGRTSRTSTGKVRPSESAPHSLSGSTSASLTSPTSPMLPCTPLSHSVSSLTGPQEAERPPTVESSSPSPSTRWTLGVRTLVVDSHGTPPSLQRSGLSRNSPDPRNYTPEPSNPRNYTPEPSNTRNYTPESSNTRNYTPDLSNRHIQPGSAPVSPYRSPLLALRCPTWTPSYQNRLSFGSSRPSFYSSSFLPSSHSYSSSSFHSSSPSPSSFFHSSSPSPPYSHSSHYTPLYSRTYTSHRPR
ncbi:protein bicaudal D homolog 1-like isoform X2 [Gouania willdenowi]|uniref:protein bicaudal D homolog 1-like isoform X2 n=1 Tax=Gouania willdenowi TaxID=441366 RepID=UPI001055EF41|nr:protein bicaudal D homolog 1-like isoform X2 [Gouania willdenowi]